MNTWKPVVSRKAYKTGGLVQDRIDSGAGPTAANSMGHASAEAKLARKQASADRQASRDKGKQLTSWQKERRAGDAAELGEYKALAGEPTEIAEPTTASVVSAEDSGLVDDVMPEGAAVPNLIQSLNVGRKPLPSNLAGGAPFGTNSLDTGLTLPGLQRGGTVDYRNGGPVGGGPLGRDTVPVVSKPGGPVEAMIDNGEYVLPKKVVQGVGKPQLDQLVAATTGKKPVGYESGGFFGRFMNRGKQIDKAVDDAVMGKAEPEPEPEPTSTSMRDIMREIRKKNPPTQQKVRRYAGGGLLMDRESIRERMRDAQPLPKFVSRADRPGANYRGPREGASVIERTLSDDALQQRQQRLWGNMPGGPAPQEAPEVITPEVVTPEVEPGTEPRTEPAASAPSIPALASPDVAPSPSFIRRARPQDESPITDEAVRAEMAANPDKYQGNALGIDGPTMARANLYSRGPGKNAFSTANVAQARADAQAFEGSKTAQQARTVKDINADTEALRDLRRVRTNLADGRPADYRKPEVAQPVQPKLSDMLGIANFQRGMANDRRDAAQDSFSNNVTRANLQRQQVTDQVAAQDRYAEQAEKLAPSLQESLPWLGEQAGPFFQRAGQISSANPMQAANLLAGAQQARAEDDGLAFAIGDQQVKWSDAVKILQGEEPLGWAGDKFYEAARRRAVQALQDDALEALSKIQE